MSGFGDVATLVNWAGLPPRLGRFGSGAFLMGSNTWSARTGSSAMDLCNHCRCGLLLQTSHAAWSACVAHTDGPCRTAEQTETPFRESRLVWAQGTMYWMEVHFDAIWRIRLNDQCAALCQITLTTCSVAQSARMPWLVVTGSREVKGARCEGGWERD